MNSPSETQLYKIVIVGDTGTGKTNIITKFVSNYFDAVSRPTIGVEFFQKSIEVETSPDSKQRISLQIWDTAGQERFRGMASSYYRKAFGVVLVYDITNRDSFSNLDRWVEEVHSYAEQEVEIVLIGNKKDLADMRQVTVDEGLGFSKTNELLFFETSALNNEDRKIEEVFKELAKRIEGNEKLKGMKESSLSEGKRKIKDLQEITVKSKKTGRKCC